MSEKEICIQHYNSSQKILLVGEGDFSFSACLANAFGSAVNMVATSLDSKGTLLRIKYNDGRCQRHLKDLENKGCLLLHEVNVKNMNKNPILKDMKFDVIVFNFPHAGHCGLHETEKVLINMHKNLLKAFFGSARKMLKEGGEVHVTHRDDHPYNKWKLEELARAKGFLLKEKVLFRKEDFPGYNNKRGSIIRANRTFPLKECFTFKFSLKSKITSTSDQTLTNSLGDSLIISCFAASF